MADFDEALGHVQEARQHNDTAQAQLRGVGDDTGTVLNAIPDEDLLAGVLDALETVRDHGLAARVETDEASSNVRAADDTGHFTEAVNALSLIDHAWETAWSIASKASDAYDKVHQANELLKEVADLVAQINGAADEAIVSTGGAEENLEQLAQRLASGG